MHMKLIISPAKSLNWENNFPEIDFSTPVFLEQAVKVNTSLKRYSKKKLMELQSISSTLAELNWDRNQVWEPVTDLDRAKPAVFAFNGDVYNGLDVMTLSKEKIPLLQKQLRILSGLYGLLKPLDLILPYRLEMGTQLKIRRRDNLYAFWADSIAKSLKSEMEDGEVLLNLASNEYFKAVDTKALKREVVNVKFMDWSNGKHKIISFFAKKARGSMVRFILDNNINEVEKVKMFDTDGYYFNDQLSNNNNLVFLNDRNNN